MVKIMKQVQILLSTYNGEKYLDEQLTSIFSQKGTEVSVLVRDDGSTDQTISILEKWAHKSKLSWYRGDNLKPAKSFLNLISHTEGYDYYALCDQDDVWLPEKIVTAVNILYNEKAHLYYSTTTLVDNNLNDIEQITFPDYDFDFYQSIMYNHISGCTMVFSEELRKVLANHTPKNIVMHDWWIILVCKSIGMETVYDLKSQILYRQHGENTVGLSKNAFPFRYWAHCIFRPGEDESKMIADLYELYGDKVKEEYKRDIELLSSKKMNFINKIHFICNKKYRTKGIKENVGFALKIIFNHL